MRKFKQWQDAEYTVTNVDVSRQRLAIGGVFDEYDAVAAVNIRHKGHLVAVGSGLAAEQRIRWAKDPSQIVRLAHGVSIARRVGPQRSNANDSLRADWKADHGGILFRVGSPRSARPDESEVPADQDCVGWQEGHLIDGLVTGSRRQGMITSIMQISNEYGTALGFMHYCTDIMLILREMRVIAVGMLSMKCPCAESAASWSNHTQRHIPLDRPTHPSHSVPNAHTFRPDSSPPPSTPES